MEASEYQFLIYFQMSQKSVFFNINVSKLFWLVSPENAWNMSMMAMTAPYSDRAGATSSLVPLFKLFCWIDTSQCPFQGQHSLLADLL